MGPEDRSLQTSWMPETQGSTHRLSFRKHRENASLVKNTTNKMKYSIRMTHSKASRSKLQGKDNIKESSPVSLFTGPAWPVMAYYIAADRLLIRILN